MAREGIGPCRAEGEAITIDDDRRGFIVRARRPAYLGVDEFEVWRDSGDQPYCCRDGGHRSALGGSPAARPRGQYRGQTPRHRSSVRAFPDQVCCDWVIVEVDAVGVAVGFDDVENSGCRVGRTIDVERRERGRERIVSADVDLPADVLLGHSGTS
ncbi:hypothetical protein OG563_00160 [Nocardia vinacea]|uniref:Uncharacterized protein n=1 Tax=Nocardia vinacea TaxID=96468 RepID=A0ABZ1YUL1_9NOCA|nr:hypothetical protein [Nocardia vinacea]